MAVDEAETIARALSRDVLASFLPNFLAIKTFEKMQQAVVEVIDSGGIDAVQLEAIFASVQANAALDAVTALRDVLDKLPPGIDTAPLEARLSALELRPPFPDLGALTSAVEALQMAPAAYPLAVRPPGIRSITTTGGIEAGDFTILADATGGAIAFNLPVAATAFGLVLNVKKTDASGNAVTVTAAGAETIDGAATYPLAAQYATVTIQCDGAAWWVL